MTEHELVDLVSAYLVGNWRELLGAFVGVLLGSISLTWLVVRVFHKQQIDFLLQRIAHHESNFSQFSALMEQRLLIAEKNAELLRVKLDTTRNQQTSTENAAQPAREPAERQIARGHRNSSDDLGLGDHEGSREFDRPTVLRRSTSHHREKAEQQHDLDYLDLPVFLRTNADDDEARVDGEEADQSDRRSEVDPNNAESQLPPLRSSNERESERETIRLILDRPTLLRRRGGSGRLRSENNDEPEPLDIPLSLGDEDSASKTSIPKRKKRAQRQADSRIVSMGEGESMRFAKLLDRVSSLNSTLASLSNSQ